MSVVSCQTSGKQQEHGANIAEIARLNSCSVEEIIDFSSNLNPFGVPKSVELAIIENIGNISNYLDENDKLKQALSGYLRINADNLLLDNGSAALIYKLFPFLGLKSVKIIGPTFSEYERAARAYGCEIAVSRQPSAVSNAIFICNPNNPTATLKNKDEIIELVNKAAADNSYLIVDEAFMDFVEDQENFSVKNLVEEIPNLIVLRSLTKFFALAGLRIGYLCANKNLIKKLKAQTPPWPINTLTSQATIAALGDKEYIKQTRSQMPILKNDLITRLSQIDGVEVYPSSVNFVLARIKKPISSTDIYHQLAAKRILIRDCASFGMKENFIRLAVKMPTDHEKLAKNLYKIIQEATK